MSATIDDRIVSLEFDNDQFEKGVGESLNTLQKLKDSLKMDDAAKNLSAISDAGKNIDLSSVSDSIDRLSDKFSTLRLVGVMALSHIVDAAFEVAKKIGSVLTAPLNQIKTGGWSRAMNIENAKFQLEGLHVAWETVSDDIDYAVSGTAYGLDAAAKACAQLVASGVEAGEGMKQALRGVSGVAAMTNTSYEEIAPIFTTIAGQGKVMTMQLRQLENRGLNAAATLGDALGVTEQEVRDMVTHGEIDFATFAAAMDDAFGEHAKEANNTLMGAFNNVKAALSRIGQEFATPLIHNAIPVLNAIRNMINAIKTNLTPVYRVFAELFKIVGDALTSKINRLTTIIKYEYASVTDFARGLSVIMISVIRIIKTVGSAFSQVFNGSIGEHFASLTKGFYNLTLKLQPTESALEGFRKVLVSLFTVVKTVGTVIGWLIKKLGTPFIVVLTKVVNLIFTMVNYFARLVEIIGVVIRNFGNFDNVINALRSHGVDFGNKTEKLRTVFQKLSEVASKAGKIISTALKTVGNVILTIVATPIILLYTAFQKLMSLDWSKFTSALTHAKELVIEFVEKVKELPIVQTIVEGLKNAFTMMIGGLMILGAKIEEFFNKLANGEITIDSIKNKLMSIPETFKNVGLKIRELFVNGPFKSIGALAKKALDGLKKIVSGVKSHIKELTPAKVMLMAFAGVMMMLALNANGLIFLFNQILSRFFKFLVMWVDLKNPITRFQNTVLTLSKMFLSIAAAITILAQIPKEDLYRAAGVLAAMVGVLLAISILMTILETKAKFTGFKQFSISMSLLSLGLLSAALSLTIIAEMPLEGALKRVGLFGLALLEIIAAVTLLSVINTKIGALPGFFGLMGVAVMMVAVAYTLKKIESVDFSRIKGSWKEISAVLFGFAALAAGLARITGHLSITVIAFVIAMKLILANFKDLQVIGTKISDVVSNALDNVKNVIVNIGKKLSEMWDALVKAIGDVRAVGVVAGSIVVAIIAIIALISAIKLLVTHLTFGVVTVSRKGKYIRRAAAAFLMIAAAVAGLIILSKYLSDWLATDPERLWKALGIITGFIVLAGVFMAVSKAADAIALQQARKVITAMGFLMLSLTAFTAVMGTLTADQWQRAQESMKSALNYIMVIVLGASFIGRVSKLSVASFSTFAGLTLLVGLLVGTLAYLMLALKDPEDYYALGASVVAIMFLLGTLAVVLTAASKIQITKGLGVTGKILAIGGVVALIGGVIGYMASKLPDEHYIGKVVTISLAMVGVITALMILTGLMTKFAKSRAIQITTPSEARAFGDSLISLGTMFLGLLAIAGSLLMLKNVGFLHMASTAIVLVSVLLALTLVAKAVANLIATTPNVRGAVAILAALAGVFVVLATTVGVLEHLGGTADRMLAVSQTITLIIGEFAAIIAILGKLNISTAMATAPLIALGVLTGIFTVLAITIGVLEHLGGSADRVLAISQVVVLIIAEFAIMIGILGALTEAGGIGAVAAGTIPTLLTLTAIFVILAATIGVLEKFGGTADRMLAVSQVIVLVIFELAAIVAGLGALVLAAGIGAMANATIPILLALTAIFAVLGVTIAVIEQMGSKADRMLAVSQVVVLVIFELTIIAAVLGKLAKHVIRETLVIPILLTLTACFVILATAIGVLEKFGGEAERLRKSADVVTDILWSMVGIIYILGKIGRKIISITIGTAAVAALTICFAAISVCMAALDKVNPLSAMLKVKAITEMLWAMTKMVAIFSILSLGAVGMISGAVSMAILSASILAIAIALKALEPVSYDNISKGLDAVSKALIILLSAGAAAALLAPGLGVLSTTIISLGLGCLAAGVGVYYFAEGISTLASTTPQQLMMIIDVVRGFFAAIGQGIATGIEAIITVVVNGIGAMKEAALMAARGFLPDLIKSLFDTSVAEAAAEASGMRVGKRWTKGFKNGIPWHSPPEPTENFKRDAAKSLRNDKVMVDAAAKNADDTATSWTDTFKNGTIEKFNDVKSTINDTFSGMMDGVKDLAANKASEIGTTISNNIKEKTDGTEFEGMFDGLLSAAEEVDNAAKKFQIDVKGAGTLADFAYQNQKREVLELDTAWASSNRKMIDYYAKMQNALQRGNKGLAAYYKREWEAASLANREAEKAFKGAKTAAEGASEAIDGYTESITNAGSSSKSAASDMASSLQSTLESQMNIFDKFEAKAAMSKEELLSNMKSQIDGMLNWAANMDKLATLGIDKGLYKKLAEMGPQGAQYVGAFASMTAEELAQANSMWAQSLTLPGDVANRITNDWASISGDMVNGLAAGWTDNEGVFHDAALLTSKNLQEDFKADNEIHSPSRVYWWMGYNMVSGLRFGIWENRELPIGVMRRVSKLIKETAETILDPEGFKSIGANLAAGIAQGMDENTELVSKASAKLVSVADDAARKAGLIQSPSRLFAEIGKYLDMGLAKGISGNSGMVTTSINTVFDKVVDDMKYTIANVAATLQDGIEDPVITPVLDLSRVQAGIKTLNHSFSTQQALSAAGSMSTLQNGQSSGGVNFIQNNYSPKPLSRTEIYRQTNNQLTMLRRVAVN